MLSFLRLVILAPQRVLDHLADDLRFVWLWLFLLDDNVDGEIHDGALVRFTLQVNCAI